MEVPPAGRQGPRGGGRRQRGGKVWKTKDHTFPRVTQKLSRQNPFLKESVYGTARWPPKVRVLGRAVWTSSSSRARGDRSAVRADGSYASSIWERET